MPNFLFEPWIRYPGTPRVNLNGPSGLSGPAGTTVGRISPSAACSARIEAGGVQVGFGVLAVILVLAIGEPQPSRPIPNGKVCTTFCPFGK
ncbi:hypothetical protein D3C79_885450 [compost metagenome]